MPHVGDILVGRYRIDAPLGAGGSAMVYRAHDLRLRRDVALKVLLPNLASDPAVAHRFEREARSLAAVNHPGIVAVYDVEAADRRADREPFFVMELCERGSLADLLVARGGRLSPDEVVPLIADVAGGLTSLHARGFVHRDVKPHNILLTGGGAKLGDFGIARGTESAGEMTAAGHAIGTLAYLAPELLAGGSATPASDVFALGVVTYQALTGQLPRLAETVVAFMGALSDPIPAPSALRDDLGPYFDAPIAGALAADPAARPAPNGFGGALKAAVADWRRAGRRTEGAAPPTDSPASGIDPAAPRPVRLAPPDPALAAAARTATVRLRPGRRPPPPDWLPVRRRNLAGPAIAAGMLAVLAGLVAFALLGGLGFLGGAPSGTLPSSSESASPEPSISPSDTPSPSPSDTPSPSPSESPTPSPISTPTPEPSPAATATPGPTAAPTPAPSPGRTPPPIVDPAQARTYLGNVRTAVANAAATGRVSGEDADALLLHAAGIASDLDARDYVSAANDTLELVRVVDDLERQGRFDQPAELRRALTNLQSVLPRPTT